MNAMMKVRVSLASFGFAVALMFAPSAHAQAESSPDHFTETGVEIGPGGQVAVTHASASTAQTHTQAAKPATAQANHSNTGAQPVQVAMAVADKNRAAVATAPKQ